MELKWRKVYETGVEEIDNQHKKLFTLLSILYETPMHEKGLKLKESMDELLGYAKFHFAEEEKYWEEIGLPQHMIEHHKAEHSVYLREINQTIKNHFEDGMFLSMSILDFLKDWIIDHVLGEDMEYVKWVEENGTK